MYSIVENIGYYERTGKGQLTQSGVEREEYIRGGFLEKDNF